MNVFMTNDGKSSVNMTEKKFLMLTCSSLLSKFAQSL